MVQSEQMRLHPRNAYNPTTEIMSCRSEPSCSCAKQTIEFLLGNAVALAGAADQAAAIDDRDVAKFVADEAGPF